MNFYHVRTYDCRVIEKAEINDDNIKIYVKSCVRGTISHNCGEHIIKLKFLKEIARHPATYVVNTIGYIASTMILYVFMLACNGTLKKDI